MNKNKSKAVIICAVLSLLLSTFFASCIGVSAAGGIVTQTGDTEVTASVVPQSEIITIAVFPDGKSYSDLLGEDKTNYNDIMVYGNEFSVTPGVEKTFKMDLSNTNTGKYVMLVSENGTISRTPFDFERRDLKRIALALINGASSISEVEEYVTTYSTALGISEADYQKLDKTALATFIYNTVKSGTVLKENDTPTDNIIASSVAVGLIKADKLENIYSRASGFGFETTDLAGVYNGEFVTAEMELGVTERIKTMDLSSPKKLEESFKEAFILSVVEHSLNYRNVKTVIEKYSTFIGAGQGVSVKVFGQITGMNFESKDALKAQLIALSGGDSDGGNGSGGSGGFGGGGGGGSSVRPANPDGIRTPDEIQTVVPQEKLPTDIFTDLYSVEWAKASIVGLAEKGIISGKGDALFCPNDNVTRYEFAKLAVMTFMPDAEAKEVTFSDVPAKHWGMEFVKKAFGAELINGRTADTFDGDGRITREEMAVILYRAAKKSGIVMSDYADAKNYKFRDDSGISDFAKEAVYVLKYDGIINGVGDDRFAPADYATRAEAAHMIYTLSQL